MCAKENALGRGLGSLIRNAEMASNRSNNLLPISLLKPRKDQPRKHFDQNALEELAASIRLQGILQPILVRPINDAIPVEYEIIAGERRYLAAKIAQLKEVPVLIREFEEEDVLTIALIENIQRENLNPIEEARGIDDLRKFMDFSQEELAHKLGKSRSAIANSLRLLQLSESILYSLEQDKISAGHARALLSITDENVREQLHQMILDKYLSVRDVESASTYFKRHNSLPESLSGIKEEFVKKTQAAKSREKLPVIQSLQGHLRKKVHPKVTLSGTPDMGRITLPYESGEQLAFFLDLLGINKGLDDEQA